MLIRRARSRGDVSVFVGSAQQIRPQLYSALELRATMLLIRWYVRAIYIGAEPALVWESGAVSPVCCRDMTEVDALLASTHHILHEAPQGPRGNLLLWSRTLDSSTRLVQFLSLIFNTQKRKREDCPEQPKTARTYHSRNKSPALPQTSPTSLIQSIIDLDSSPLITASSAKVQPLPPTN